MKVSATYFDFLYDKWAKQEVISFLGVTGIIKTLDCHNGECLIEFKS